MSRTMKTEVPAKAPPSTTKKQYPEPEVCRFCDGEGVVETKYGVQDMCPVCDGEGLVWKS